MPWPLNCVEKVMTLVVPPASAEVLPVTNVSSSAPPPACSCSIWQCESTPPGITSRPFASIVRSPRQVEPDRGDATTDDPDIGLEHIGRVTTVPPAITRS